MAVIKLCIACTKFREVEQTKKLLSYASVLAGDKLSAEQGKARQKAGHYPGGIAIYQPIQWILIIMLPVLEHLINIM